MIVAFGATLILGIDVLGRISSIWSSGIYDRGSCSTGVREELLAVRSLIRAGDVLASCAGDALESCSKDLLPGLPIASAASRRGDGSYIVDGQDGECLRSLAGVSILVGVC